MRQITELTTEHAHVNYLKEFPMREGILTFDKSSGDMKMKILEKIRISVLDRDNRKCLWCGRNATDSITLDVDHVLAEYWGRETTYENLGTLCSHYNKDGVFLPQIIEHEYFIGGLFLETQENDDTNIQIEEIKNKALLQFKDKIGDYLFENKGFLEELDDKLIFRERK